MPRPKIIIDRTFYGHTYIATGIREHVYTVTQEGLDKRRAASFKAFEGNFKAEQIGGIIVCIDPHKHGYGGVVAVPNNAEEAEQRLYEAAKNRAQAAHSQLATWLRPITIDDRVAPVLGIESATQD
ncbi:hypothetical protein ACFL1B_02800 [Nanoarchaeota archaeon]